MILCLSRLYSNKASFAYAFANVSSISLLRAAFQIDFGPILRCLRTPKIVILLRTSLKSHGFHFVAIRSAWIASPNPRPPRLDRNFEAPVASRPSFWRYKQKQKYLKNVQKSSRALFGRPEASKTLSGQLQTSNLRPSFSAQSPIWNWFWKPFGRDFQRLIIELHKKKTTVLRLFRSLRTMVVNFCFGHQLHTWTHIGITCISQRALKKSNSCSARTMKIVLWNE